MPHAPSGLLPPCSNATGPLRFGQRTQEKGTVIAKALTIKSGSAAGRRIEVEGPQTIGREEADITIEDPEISRHHAEVRVSGDDLEVEDLGSTNGTFVNGNRISSATTLSPGDTVRVGQTEFQVEASSSAGGTVVAPTGGTAISQSPAASSEPAEEETQAWEPAPTGGDAAASEPPAAYIPPAASSPPPAAAGYTPPPGDYTPPSQTGGAPYTPPVAQGGYQPPPQQSPPSYQGSPSYQSGPGSYGGPAKSGGGSKLPLIIGAIVLLLALAAVALFVWPGFLKANDEEKVREVVTAFGEEIDDPEAFCALFTQRFLEETSGETGSAAVDACETDVEAQGQEPIEVTINSVDVQGESATVEASAEGESGTFELVNEDGEWLIDSTS